jgi:hypothetical protein
LRVRFTSCCKNDLASWMAYRRSKSK